MQDREGGRCETLSTFLSQTTRRLERKAPMSMRLCDTASSATGISSFFSKSSRGRSRETSRERRPCAVIHHQSRFLPFHSSSPLFVHLIRNFRNTSSGSSLAGSRKLQRVSAAGGKERRRARRSGLEREGKRQDEWSGRRREEE